MFCLPTIWISRGLLKCKPGHTWQWMALQISASITWQEMGKNNSATFNSVFIPNPHAEPHGEQRLDFLTLGVTPLYTALTKKKRHPKQARAQWARGPIAWPLKGDLNATSEDFLYCKERLEMWIMNELYLKKHCCCLLFFLKTSSISSCASSHCCRETTGNTVN